MKSTIGPITKRFAIGVAVLINGVGIALPADSRTWKDASGSFSVDGTFEGEKDGTVTIKLESGEEVEIDVEQLSEKDQEYIKSQAKTNPFQPKSSSPFTPKSDTAKSESGGSMSAEEGVVDDSGEFEDRLISVATFGAEAIGQITSEGGWKIESADFSGPRFTDNSGKPISLPPKTDFFEKTVGVVFNPGLSHAVVGYTLDRDAKQTRLVLLGLDSGRTIANVTTGGLLAPVALADDGKTILMRRAEFGFGNADRLEIWTISGSSIKKGPAWLPYDDTKGSGRDVLFGEFYGDNELVTASAGGQVTGWSVSPVKQLWTCRSVTGCKPAISPDRKHIVFADDKQILLVDMPNRKIIASRPIPKGAFPKFGFSPSGKRFGMMAQNSSGYVWDSSTGEEVREVENALLPSVGPPQSPLFANDDQIIFAGQYLVDLPSMIPLWSYERSEATERAGDAIWFVAHDGDRGPGVMFGAKLPHVTVKEALDKALKDPNFFVFKEGTSVTLNLDKLTDAAKREEIRKAWAEQLEKLDIRVTPDAEVTLTASFNEPKDENIVYHGFRGRQAVDFKRITGQVEILWQGKSIWKANVTNLPHFIRHSRDESLEAAVKKYEGVPYDAVKSIRLPKMLAKPSDNKSGQLLGSSQITTSGIR